MSAIFAVMDPRHRSAMQRDAIYWTRYQLKHDHHIFKICSELKRHHVISKVLVTKDHLTAIQHDPQSAPVAIRAIPDFARVFNNSALVSSVIRKHTEPEVVELEEAAEAETVEVDVDEEDQPSASTNAVE